MEKNETWVIWSKSVLRISELRNCRIVSPSAPYNGVFGTCLYSKLIEAEIVAHLSRVEVRNQTRDAHELLWAKPSEYLFLNDYLIYELKNIRGMQMPLGYPGITIRKA